ncbi:MAG: DUF1553 domain-containing protein [Planctomycetota bacterium]|nr:MAG: DUF1553 domain-containing protein [Planctomycetota bacterium]
MMGGRVVGADQAVQFDRDILPILADKCYACHGPDASQRAAELRLDDAGDAVRDRGGYQVIVPGNPEDSELVRRIWAEPDEQMPPADYRKQLTARERRVLVAWIRQGAERPAHWAYMPPRRHPIPPISEGTAARNFIDAFVLAQLQERGIRANPPADRRTLLRRLSWDLIGLPPTDQELAHFLHNASADAYEMEVDRLLQSPHFGERMAVLWLDLVRYADTVGYHGDQNVSISPYRDYVIHAFNSNKPWDQFTVEQLAGDLLPEPSVETLVASGYNRLGMMSAEGGVQPEEYLAKYAADRVRNAGTVWLGSTLGCAECHDHKFDPFTTHDFYSFAAFFADIKEQGLYAGAHNTGKWGPSLDVPDPQLPALLASLDLELDALRTQLQRHSDESAERQEVAKRIEALEAQRKTLVAEHTRSTLITETVTPREMRVLPRGNWMDKSGEVVTPQIPQFLGRLQPSHRATRLDLARWIVSRDNPLTARVMVNRLWKLMFGRGLSKTLDDVGSQGEVPSHPELLDTLAVEFMDSGWDVKYMLKLIATSATYQQSSQPRPELEAVDPYNRLLARQSRYRLDAEFLRDNALSVSGLLVRVVGGRSVKPYQPPGLYEHLNFPKRVYEADVGADQYRRGVYTHWQRQFLHPALKAFDAPSREECTAQRPRSNTPLGALVLLNDPSYIEAARRFALRALSDAPREAASRADWMVRQAVGRPAEPEEIAILVDLAQAEMNDLSGRTADAQQLLAVGQAPAGAGDPVELAAWTAVARAIFNMHEFVTRN